MKDSDFKICILNKIAYMPFKIFLVLRISFYTIISLTLFFRKTLLTLLGSIHYPQIALEKPEANRPIILLCIASYLESPSQGNSQMYLHLRMKYTHLINNTFNIS